MSTHFRLFHDPRSERLLGKNFPNLDDKLALALHLRCKIRLQPTRALRLDDAHQLIVSCTVFTLSHVAQQIALLRVHKAATMSLNGGLLDWGGAEPRERDLDFYDEALRELTFGGPAAKPVRIP